MASTVFQKMRPFLIVYLLLFTGGLLIRLVYSRNAIFFEVNRWHTPAADAFFSAYTHFGDMIAVFTLVFLLSLYSVRLMLFAGVAELFSSLAGQCLKLVFRFPRPSAFYLPYYQQHRDADPLYLIPGVHMLSNYSFPSGHSIAAFAFVTVFAFFTRKNLAPLWILPALLVAFSRMYLKQHFFEDVLAGSFVGVTITFGVIVFLNRLPLMNRPALDRGLLRQKP